MKDINALRLFEEIRLHPWKPQDKVIIDAHLAMYSVTNPKLAAEIAKRYMDKMDAKFPKVAKATEEKPVVEEKKKKGRKILSLSAHE